MSKPRALAAAQTVAVAGDVEANIAQHLQLIAAAAPERPQVLAFPELSLTGYELLLCEKLAFSVDDGRLQRLRKAAREHAITLVVGAPIATDAGLHIGAFALGADGSIDHYEKRHLGAFRAADGPNGVVPPPEPSVFCPGTRDPLLDLGGHPAALSVCKDSLYVEHAQRAAARGASIYVSSQFGIPAHLGFKVEMLQKHATYHGMAIVLSNYAGVTGGLRSGGGSGIWTERGASAIQLDAAGCGVAFAVEYEPGRWRGKAIML